LSADERKHVLVNNAEHLARLEILEFRPAQIFVGLAALVLAFGKNAPFERFAQRGGFQFLDLLHVVEAFDENQIGDLLDDLQRDWRVRPTRNHSRCCRSGCVIRPSACHHPNPTLR
jgi:hypothetical protein